MLQYRPGELVAPATLFYLASENGTENIATIKAGSSQAVTTSGVQSVLFTGLTGGTTYYAHYVHTDVSGNNSNPWGRQGCPITLQPNMTGQSR